MRSRPGFSVSILLMLGFACATSAIGQTPAQKQKAQQLYKQALQLEAATQYAGALDAMRAAVQLVPKSETYLAYTARLAAAAGKHDESARFALQAAKINPRNTTYPILVMKGAYASQDYDLAKEFARKVTALGASRVGQEAVGEAKLILSRVDGQKAEKSFSQAIALARDGKHDQALARMKDAVALNPKDPSFQRYLAELEDLAARQAFDAYALQAPAEVESSLDSLAAYLIKPAKNDREKARLIYRWIADRIAYDVEAFFSSKKLDTTPETALKSRKGVCSGYARLFEALGKRAGLEVAVVPGSAKQHGHVQGQQVRRSTHAWNAVKLDGKWELLDSTWGAGIVNDKTFEKRYRESYFLPSPEQLICSHFPDETKWQLLPTPITRDEFERWPRPNVDLFSLGVPTQDILAKVREKNCRGLVNATAHPGLKIKLHAAPLDEYLRAGEKYRFQIEAPGVASLSIIHKGHWLSMTRKGTMFEGEVLAEKGDLHVSGQFEGSSDTRHWGLLRYKVE